MIGKFILLGVWGLLPVFAADNIPLKELYEIVKNYPTVSFCDRNITTGYWMEVGNVRHITYTGQLKRRESALGLCYCIQKHMTQKDWTHGANRGCSSRCRQVTYHLTGKPDPTNGRNAKDGEPLQKLRVIFENTPTDDPIGLNCTSKCSEKSCSMVCPLVNEKRTNEKLCADLAVYYNQNDWWNGVTFTCGVTNDVLQADFKGSAICVKKL